MYWTRTLRKCIIRFPFDKEVLIPEESFRMTQDVAKESYRGVLCMSCRQPIPLPAIVIRMEVLPEDKQSQRRELVFKLRCRACDREKPYRSRDIVEFEGTPRRRASNIRTPQAVGRQAGGLSRAANG